MLRMNGERIATADIFYPIRVIIVVVLFKERRYANLEIASSTSTYVLIYLAVIICVIGDCDWRL
jgi:hypothetical protein